MNNDNISLRFLLTQITVLKSLLNCNWITHFVRCKILWIVQNCIIFLNILRKNFNLLLIFHAKSIKINVFERRITYIVLSEGAAKLFYQYILGLRKLFIDIEIIKWSKLETKRMLGSTRQLLRPCIGLFNNVHLKLHKRSNSWFSVSWRTLRCRSLSYPLNGPHF